MNDNWFYVEVTSRNQSRAQGDRAENPLIIFYESISSEIDEGLYFR